MKKSSPADGQPDGRKHPSGGIFYAFLSHTNDRTWRRCPEISGTPMPEKQNAKSEDTGMSQMRGMQSAELEREVYIAAGASVAGKKRGGKGPPE